MEQTREPQKAALVNSLKDLGISQLVNATNNFLSLVDTHDPRYNPENITDPKELYKISGRYINEYLPLLNEWGRKQSVDPDYNQKEHSPIIEKLRGDMPESLRQELIDLQKKQSDSGQNWDAETDGNRLIFLQTINQLYRDGLKLPFPWLETCLKNKQFIRQTKVELEKKQVEKGLSQEEIKFLNFLEAIKFKEFIFSY